MIPKGYKCPICSGTDFRYITEEGEHFEEESTHICMACSLVFLYPIEDKSEYYLSDQFSRDFRGMETPSEAKKAANTQNAQERWRVIRPFIPEKGTLLEIGCSSGEFLGIASRDYGEKYSFYGVDASTGFASSGVSGAEVKIGLFPETDWAEIPSFSVIASFHTLEHVPDPVAFLQHVYDRLEEGGIFCLEYPDVTRAVSARKALPVTYFQKSHLYDFSEPMLIELCRSIGFKVVARGEYSQYPSEKNLMLVFQKTDEVSEIAFGEEFKLMARSLYEVIKLKLTSPAKEGTYGRRKKLTILHVGSHHINIGDGAITSGIHSLVEKVTGGYPTEWINLDIVDYTYNGNVLTAEVFNDMRPDLILVGGGGTIDGHETRKDNGTAFAMPIEEIEKLHAPLGFVALGHNSFRNQEFFHKDKLAHLLRYCADAGVPFSVRRDGSWERMSEMFSGTIMDTIKEVPDPGFFVKHSAIDPMSRPPFGHEHIVVQLAVDGYGHRFPATEDKDSRDAAIDCFSVMAEWIKKGAMKERTFTMALHTTDDLYPVAVMLQQEAMRQPNVKRLAVRTTGISHPIYAAEFFSTYQRADLVVGMRGHSVICAAGLGTPVIPISTHDKVAGFVEEAGLAEWQLDPADPRFPERLDEYTSELLSYPKRQLDAVEQATKHWEDELVEYLRILVDKV